MDCYIDGALSTSGLFMLEMRDIRVVGQLFIEGNIDREADDPLIDVEISNCSFEGINSIVRMFRDTRMLKFERESYTGVNLIKDSDELNKNRH